MKKMNTEALTNERRKKVIVVGAGAAGLMASIASSEAGNQTEVYEKNRIIGKKLLITGKGRCNITNDTDIQGLIGNIPGNGHFLYSTLNKFSNHDIVDFFETNGLPTKVERGGRVFPASDKAEDVVMTLLKACERNSVKIHTGKAVQEIAHENGHVSAIRLRDGAVEPCDSVILCTGGSSYKSTGSTGDGYAMASKLGHTVTQLRPALVPIVTEEIFVRELEGLALKNVKVTLSDDSGQRFFEEMGELLFTQFGVSGPLILSASRHVSYMDKGQSSIIIDMKPALSYEVLDSRIQRDFLKFSRKRFKNSLDELLPAKMIPVIVSLSGIDPEKQVNQITKDERTILGQLLKGFKLTVKGTRPLEEGIVTSGGISVNEIDPGTMKSKIIEGLFFAGEIIDTDGYTGGFNLTIAFSTGHTAGENA